MKKIIKRIAAIICVAVFTISNIVMPVSAAFVGAVSLPALFTFLTAVLVAAGINSQTEVDGMTRSELLNSYSKHRQEIAEKKAAEDWADGWDIIKNALQDFIDDYSVLSDDLAFGDWVQENQDSVATESTIDLNGYGAVCIHYSNGELYKTVYGAYGIIFINADNQIAVYTDSNYSGSVKYASDSYSTSFSGSRVVGYFNDGTTNSYLLSGDWRYDDGTPADDVTTESEDVPLPIGTVIIDGVTYTINDDGTITKDGDTYYPDYDLSVYDDSALIDLLKRLLELLNNATVPDETADEETDDIIEDVEPAVIEDADFGKLTMDKSIATVFPFCIPFDFYNGIKLLATDPVAPRFEVPFEIPQYGSFPGFKKMIVIDFSEYEKYFYVVRWGMFAIAMFGMCFLTFKIVKGA